MTSGYYKIHLPLSLVLLSYKGTIFLSRDQTKDFSVMIILFILSPNRKQHS